MLKRSLAMIAIGSIVTSSSFAITLPVSKMFMKNHIMKSSLVSHKRIQKTHSGFSGTWAGTCNYDGKDTETKLQVTDTNHNLTIADNSGPEAESITFDYNVVQHRSNSDEYYTSITTFLTREDDNTLMMEGSGVFKFSFPSKDDVNFVTMLFTSTFTLNNNQLTIDTTGTGYQKQKAGDFTGKCILNRVGNA